MKRKSLLISLVSLFLILSSLVMLGITYGWYADVIDLNSGTISVGDLRYSETGAFIANDSIIYPNLELIDTALTVTNESPIDSQMRVKISYTKVTRPVDVLVIETANFSNSVDDHLSVTFDSTFFYDTDYWYYNSKTYNISANSGLINIISSLYYDGDKAGNDYVGQTIGITITIEIKQNDNVAWSELATYDFSTGYPA